MYELLTFLGFLLLFLRFAYWVGSSLNIQDKKWQWVLLGQGIEGVLLLFFYSQLFGGTRLLLFQKNLFIEILGFILVVAGVLGAFLAKKQLGKAWVYSSAYRIIPKQPLITKGIYSIVRHPIYTGIFISFVGIELLAGSWLWISMVALLIPFYFQAKKEEIMLEKHFGRKYTEYKRETKMLVPWLF